MNSPVIAEFKLHPQQDILDDEIVIEQTMPPGIEIRKNSYGHGLFVTQHFKKGDILYIGKQQELPSTKFQKFRLVTDKGTYHLDSTTHCVHVTESKMSLYTFDAFTNHSCDPSTCSEPVDGLPYDIYYATVAMRDMEPGDEINSDYTLFDYDCLDKRIEQCCCGASCCLGSVAGFKYLSTEERRKRFPYADATVLRRLAADPANKFLFIEDLRVPAGRVEIQHRVSPVSYSIVAVRDFVKGEIISDNKSLLFPEDYDVVGVLPDGTQVWIDNLKYTVNRGDGKRELY
jgi:hypothetical protein